MEILSERQSKILERARESGRVEVEELSSRFTVSPQTIRKDLNELCDKQLLQRVHGGAIVGSGIENVSYEARRMLAPAAKKAIAISAAALIPDNSSLLLNIGTTTEQVAHSLNNHRGLLVITNNINTIEIMKHFPNIELIIAGGQVRRSDGGIVGVAAVDFINQFKVDYAVIGVSAIDEDGALLDYDFREVRVAQAIIKNARHVILVADAMKFERSAPIRIGHISQITTLVTDKGLPGKLQDICKIHNIGIVIAQP
ncbi:DeoR/GlpR family DNA-binding transcription regulator [Desulforhopalus sp. IMCC35007]|uniref:DeoR/GlpR family DNA-binding transcription regulator n=1 Tax=Desulforhopalus sp. IMCC35007 TaxID=2569543 RepID=UPI0010ADA9CF|nr:DeoR/GlpR family DNA-binding transcription regulator [Desulforhopalus sp. IMCC35007]TKB11855.1 DeoR/GlpR transcriptional regulator [Desulforhopalus sp. IMCC35007]